jgi:hypothetical protein
MRIVVALAASALLLASSITAKAVMPPVTAATTITVVSQGKPCTGDGSVQLPYSVTYIDADLGDVTHIEHVACDGTRTIVRPNGVMGSYNAYSTFMHSDNKPLLSSGPSGSLVVLLTTPAKIEVRSGKTGTLIATYPSSGSEEALYSIPSSVLSGYADELIVVDVIRTSDNSYRGTASIPYKP